MPNTNNHSSPIGYSVFFNVLLKLLVLRGGSLIWYKVWNSISEDGYDSLCEAIRMYPTEYDLLLRVLKLRGKDGRMKMEIMDWCTVTDMEVRTYQTQAVVGSVSESRRSTWVQNA